MNKTQCDHVLRPLKQGKLTIADTVTAEGPIAAVLIGIAKHAHDCPVIFTRRASGMRQHANEISLPGGLFEAGDGRSASRAALREAKEEIGLAAEDVEVMGVLPSCTNSQGLTVFPVVAGIRRPANWQLEPREVTEVMEVPLAFFLDPSNYRWERRRYQDRTKPTLVIQCGHWQIWGLTARIMLGLRLTLADQPIPP